MKISFKRLLALALCAAMLFGMLPMQQVKADDLHQFTTMDDLRELANATYEELTYAAFMGTEFVFESIELPDNLVLSMPEANVTIPAGVNVNLGTIQCVNLTVEGTLDARQAEPRESVTVSGSMNVRVYFLLDLDTQVTGMENITLGNPLLFQREGSVSTLEELQAALALAESATDGAQYSIWLSGDGIATEEDITIPSNLRLNVNAPLTVCSLNLDGVLNIQNTGTVNIQGDLLLGEYCNITGAERLTAENGMVQRVFSVSSSVELLQAAKRAATPVLEGAWEIIEITDSFELVHDVTIPAGCTLRVPVDMSIGAGCTLTVDGMMEITANVTNFGTIKNNGELTVYGNMGSVLTFAETGSYTGSGEMMVINSTYEDIIPGLDLSKVNIEQGQGIGGVRWIITAKPAPTPGPDGMYHFTSFAELEQLAAMDLRTWTDAVYDGADAFVFDTISLPENLALDFIGSSVVIPEGVTVDAHYLFASWLTVNGNLNSYVVTADEALTVTGTLAVSNGLSLRNYTELTGGDNIVLLNDQVRFVRNCNIASLEELEACIADAASCTDHRIVYELYVENEMELTKDYAIPANANFRLRAPVTIAQGATLTLNGDNNDLYATLIVNGTVVNNGFIDYEYDGGGLMDFTQGGTYAGTGTLWIPAGTLTDETFLDAFPGWMPIGYRVINEGNGWTVQYIKHFNTSFTNFEEMKELAKETYDEWTQIYYEGEGPLVIDGDITFTGNVVIEAYGKEIRIAEGATANIWQISCETLIVEGAANIRFLNVQTKLEVTGSAAVEGSISVEEETMITGRENVSGHIDRYCRIMDEDHLHRVLELAAASTDPNEVFGIDFVNSNGVILTRSVILPENTYWMVDAPLVISEGVEFVVNSYAGQIMGPVEVRGHLVNSAETQMYCDWGGSISFVSGGTYASDDALWLYYAEGDPMAYVPGIDMTGYELWQWDDQTWMIAPEGYNPGGGGGGMQAFESFEELKELAAQNWDNWIWIEYTGGDVLEITENIVLPENLQVQTPGGVRIAEGVNAWFNYLTCGWLEVNGDLHVDYADITQEGLWVNGYLSVEESINISYKASISNFDHIILQEWGTVNMVYSGTDMNLDWLREHIAGLDPYEPAKIRHAVYLDSEVTVEEDLTVPSKVNVYFQQPLTVAAGATLTLNSENVQLYAPATVYGNLNNNSWFFVSAYNGATLTFAEGSTYTGTGTIAVEKDPSVSLESVLPGLDLSNLYVRQDGDFWWYISTTQQGGGGGGLTFSTMEELQALAAESYDWGYMMYVGNEDFVISGDISMPANTYVDFGEHNVVVSEGVTGNFMELMCNNLTVYGTLNAEYIYVMGDATVNGAVKTMHMSINEATSITGLENIKFTNSYNPLSRVYYVNDGDALVAALNKAANPQLPEETALIQFNGGPVVLTEDATLPKNCEMYISNDMVIAEGATLTINGMVSIGSPLTVKGTLVNNCDIYTWDGRMTIADGGKYEGHGTLRVLGGSDYNTVFQGLNLEDFQITNNYGEWRLVYVAGLPPVAAPSELEWGYTYKDGVKVALPGAVSWKSGITDTSGIEYVYFYRINEDGSETLINEYGGVGYDAKNYMAGYNSSVDLLLSDIPSGRYYFTVYSQGDYENTKDSETVKSAVWEYTKPSDRLDTATNLGWSDDSFRAEWTNPNGEDEVHYALVSWYYKDREDGYEYIFARFISQDGDYHELPEYHMSIMGTGYYSYEVQFISADITKTLSSELSGRSGWYHLAEMPETPTVQLGTLVNDGSKTNEEKIEAVQNIGAEELKEAMQTNGDASALIEMLEQTAAGGTAKVEVADETVELAVDEIVIVGANLNSKENKEESVKLVIDKVEEVREVTGNYEASTAVQFSMTLENVKDTKNLDVPVVIILPVPEDIDPEKMVILHYHDDGSYDTIIPETYVSGGKAYAQFILTSFSDFVILEKLAALLGDVDLNQGVDVDDVLALLWAVLFPDMYPVEVEADFDHNGSVDVDDVLTLLWHVLFPDMYPL